MPIMLYMALQRPCAVVYKGGLGLLSFLKARNTNLRAHARQSDAVVDGQGRAS
jgi:hypothetical protein